MTIQTIETKTDGYQPIARVIVTGLDGKERLVIFKGHSYETNVWKNGKSYGATSTTKSLNKKIYGPHLGDQLRAAFFENCATEWKAYLEKSIADFETRGYGWMVPIGLIEEVVLYLAVKN